MGKPEDMEAEGESASADSGSTSARAAMVPVLGTTIPLMAPHAVVYTRNPDDKMLGGVISGMAPTWDGM